MELLHYMWNGTHFLLSIVFTKQIEGHYRNFEKREQKINKKQVKSKHSFHRLKINTKLILVLLSYTIHMSICMCILNMRIIIYLQSISFLFLLNIVFEHLNINEPFWQYTFKGFLIFIHMCTCAYVYMQIYTSFT